MLVTRPEPASIPVLFSSLPVPDSSPAAGSLAAGSVAAGSVAAGSVAAGSVAAGSVAAGSVAAGSVAAGSVAAALASPATRGVTRAERRAGRLEGGGHGLEEGLAADGAVTAAAGGQADRAAVLGEQRAAAVARLGADVGLYETGDGVDAVGVGLTLEVDRGVETGDRAVVQTGGAAHAEDLLTDRGVRRLGDLDGLPVADVHLARRLGGGVVVLHEEKSCGTGEGGLVDGRDRLPVLRVRPLLGRDTAVPGGQEGGGAVARCDVEAEGTADAAGCPSGRRSRHRPTRTS